MDREIKEFRAKEHEKGHGGDDDTHDIRPVEYPGLPIEDPVPQPSSRPSGVMVSNIICPYCNGTNVMSAGICKVGEPALYVCVDCRKGFKSKTGMEDRIPSA